MKITARTAAEFLAQSEDVIFETIYDDDLNLLGARLTAFVGETGDRERVAELRSKIDSLLASQQRWCQRQS